jgi:polysaccharide export outer membrane protein
MGPGTSVAWRLSAGAALVLALLSSGCASYGQYMWYSQLPQDEWTVRVEEYTLKVGDAVTVRVFGSETPSLSAKIRSDGRIPMPFAGEIVAAGKHPLQLAKEIETRLKEFLVSPRVSVSVDTASPVVVTVLGEVGNKGNQSLEPPATLLQALAQAGGLSDFADDEAIFVVRRAPLPRRIRFTWDALINNTGGAGTFQLRTGDVVVVK